MPSPEDLPQHIWIQEVLPKMGAYYGIYENQDRNAFLVNRSTAPYLRHLFPEEPQISPETWQALKDYFVQGAPARWPTTRGIKNRWPLNRFQAREIYAPEPAENAPFTTMIKFDTVTEKVYLGMPGRRASGVFRYSATHELEEIQSVLSTPSQIDFTNHYVLEMGSLTPSDYPNGSLSLFGEDTSGIILDTLARPVDFLTLDLNQNGKTEIIVAEYGNMVGGLNSYEQNDSGRWTKVQTLYDQPGALRLRKADLNQDGYPDLIALTAQGDEGVIAFLSRPGIPARQQLLRFPPSYGSSDLEIVDFDQDGHLDIFHVCGDNFDYQPIPKPYHGIRYFRNQGDGSFKENWFFPMDGAYDLEVADFDLDGDFDLAVVAYFVPPEIREGASFFYLEQTGKDAKNPAFAVQAHQKPANQNYLCLSSGDVDADGDVDLLLGNFAAYLPDGNTSFLSASKDAPVYVFMENTTR